MPLAPDPSLVERLAASLPELPAARIARFRERVRRCPRRTRQISTPTPAAADYFERVAELSGDAKGSADWVRNQPSSVEHVPAARLAALSP